MEPLFGYRFSIFYAEMDKNEEILIGPLLNLLERITSVRRIITGRKEVVLRIGMRSKFPTTKPNF